MDNSGKLYFCEKIKKGSDICCMLNRIVRLIYCDTGVFGMFYGMPTYSKRFKAVHLSLKHSNDWSNYRRVIKVVSSR